MKSKLQIGIISLLAIICLVGCQNNISNNDLNNENVNNNVINSSENNNSKNNVENEQINNKTNQNEIEDVEDNEDFPTNPKDVLGNKIDFVDTLNFTTVSGANYQVTTNGNKVIDNISKVEREATGIQGEVKSFICEAETESTEELLNFIVLNNEGKLFVAHLENKDDTTSIFEKIVTSEKILGISSVKTGFEEFEETILKTESGRLMRVSCYYEDGKVGVTLNDYIPSEEKIKYNTYMKLIGEYEFVEAKELQNQAENTTQTGSIFSEGMKLTLVNPISHGTISLSTIYLNDNKEATFWWDYNVAEEMVHMYFSKNYKTREELMFTYEETSEGILLKIMDSNYEVIFQKK